MVAECERQRECAEEKNHRCRQEVRDPIGGEIEERRDDKQRRHHNHEGNRHAHLRSCRLKKTTAAQGRPALSEYSAFESR
jgi:hypothetical protein